jgi:hypothetical protein
MKKLLSLIEAQNRGKVAHSIASKPLKLIHVAASRRLRQSRSEGRYTGLRGSLFALISAGAAARRTRAGDGLPDALAVRDEGVALAFRVAFSIFVQGLPVTPLLRWLGQIADAARSPG